MDGLFSDSEEALCVFSGMLYQFLRGDAHVGSQGFGYIGYVLRYIGARQVESSGGEIWCIRFNHDAVQWDGCYRPPEVVGTAFITNPPGDADVKSHGNEFFGHLTVSGETMDY